MSDAEPCPFQETYPERISKEAINRLPLRAYEGPVDVIRDVEAAKVACEVLAMEGVLGFDTETRPSFRKGEAFLPSLVQLAGQERVFLFQLGLIGPLEPLFAILSAAAPLKVGVAIRDDIKGLQAINSFEPNGFVEIADLTTPLGIVNTGLRPLCGILLGMRISKGAQVSNWARTDLSPAQITYAATDAWASRELYVKVRSLTPPT